MNWTLIHEGNEVREFYPCFAEEHNMPLEVHDGIWIVSFMEYDLGYFDLETRMLEPLTNPFGPKVLPMS